MKNQAFRFLGIYLMAFLLVTAAAGALPAFAESLQDSALAPASLAVQETNRGFLSAGISKENMLKIWKALSFQTPEPKPAPQKKSWDPFKAARILMTSA